MLITQPLQIGTGPRAGKWHMCQWSDESSSPPVPVGPCADGCDGHDDAKGAVQHYRGGLVPEAVVTKVDRGVCEFPGCDAPRTHDISFPGSLLSYAVCANHTDQGAIRRLLLEVE